MKGLKILFLLTIVLAVSCKTQKIAPKPEPVQEETSVSSTSTTTKDSSVKSKEEKVTAAQGEASDFGSKRFYVILGSFSVYENAQNFKKQLMQENFQPGILVNENGLYRVSVNSFDDETMARSRVAEIRQKYTKYSDVWLLIKKQ
jgi:cell division protein FtsN